MTKRLNSVPIYHANNSIWVTCAEMQLPEQIANMWDVSKLHQHQAGRIHYRERIACYFIMFNMMMKRVGVGRG
jgi:hypothetical protein